MHLNRFESGLKFSRGINFPAINEFAISVFVGGKDGGEAVARLYFFDHRWYLDWINNPLVLERDRHHSIQAENCKEIVVEAPDFCAELFVFIENLNRILEVHAFQLIEE